MKIKIEFLCCRRRRKDPMRRVMGTTKTIKLSKAATTPLVETIFTSFFSGQIMKNYTKDYSEDAVTACTTNSEFNSTRSYEDFNLVGNLKRRLAKVPFLLLPVVMRTWYFLPVVKGSRMGYKSALFFTIWYILRNEGIFI